MSNNTPITPTLKFEFNKIKQGSICIKSHHFRVTNFSTLVERSRVTLPQE